MPNFKTVMFILLLQIFSNYLQYYYFVTYINDYVLYFMYYTDSWDCATLSEISNSLFIAKLLLRKQDKIKFYVLLNNL